MKTLFSKVAFLNDQNIFLINLSHISGCYKSRLPFLSVGFGWQWISEGLSYIVCELSVQICKLKSEPLSHLNDFRVLLYWRASFCI